jgi:serine palmitoyltransferase
LVNEWQPEPLVPEMTEYARLDLQSVPVIQGPSGPRVKLQDSDGKDFLNLASYDFLGFTADTSIHAAAANALRKYGVGACGPPGFYGTIGIVHIDVLH